MAEIAPNASWHYVMGGVKGNSLDKNTYAKPLVGIRQKDFESGNEISTETDEGHTGVSNLDQGSYRTKAESSPEWEDKFRYGEFLEEIFYLLLGSYEKKAHTNGSETVTGVYDYHFELLPDTTTELPVATIYNGFAKTNTDARVWNNALLNELEINFDSEDAPTIKPKFLPDYNNMNLLNPTRTFSAESHFAKAPHSQVFVGAIGATAEEMLQVPIDCFTEASLTINNNAESTSCHADEFGRNTKVMGAREVEGSITMPWVDGTKYFETEYEAFNKYGHVVSEEITHKQIWFRCFGGNIPNFTDDTLTGVPFETIIKCPDCEITKVESPLSGDEAKDLTMEFKVLEKPTQSYMTVDITTFLEDLHIDNEGCSLSELRPNVAPFPTA